MSEVPEQSIITPTGCQDFRSLGSILQRAAEADGDLQCTRTALRILSDTEAEIIGRCTREIVFTEDGAQAIGQCMLTQGVCTMPRRFTDPSWATPPASA